MSQNQDLNKLNKAKEILKKIADGINPVNKEPIENGSFLHDPRIKRCLLFVCDIIDNEIDRELDDISRQLPKFIITPEEKSRVALPEGKIGISEFVRCINNVIDRTRSRKLTAVDINSRLKKIGILGEEKGESGKSRTILNEKSSRYGIETEVRNYNGKEYEAIVFNDTGKKFLIENLEKIMEYNKGSNLK